MGEFLSILFLSCSVLSLFASPITTASQPKLERADCFHHFQLFFDLHVSTSLTQQKYSIKNTECQNVVANHSVPFFLRYVWCSYWKWKWSYITWPVFQRVDEQDKYWLDKWQYLMLIKTLNILPSSQSVMTSIIILLKCWVCYLVPFYPLRFQ